MKIHLTNGDYIIAIRLEFAINGKEVVYADACGKRHTLAISAILFIES